MPCSLLMFAFTGAYPWVHWIGVCISATCFGTSMILLYVSANAYIIDSYSTFAATAMAAKASAASCSRPRVFSDVSSRACTPRDTRFTPAAR